jgi:hypothetical protein
MEPSNLCVNETTAARLTLADVWARVTRALEAIEDGDVVLALAILRDLDEDLYASERRAA